MPNAMLRRIAIAAAWLPAGAGLAGCNHEPTVEHAIEGDTEMITSSRHVPGKPFFVPGPDIVPPPAAPLADAGPSDAGPSDAPPPQSMPQSQPSATAVASSTAVPSATAVASAEARPGTVREKAGVGATGKRPSESRPIITPVGAFFSAAERVVFELQIPQAMKLYQAMHEDKKPATHEEFMREIIEKNSIKLLELPAGHRYVYDPKSGELLVEMPSGGN